MLENLTDGDLLRLLVLKGCPVVPPSVLEFIQEELTRVQSGEQLTVSTRRSIEYCARIHLSPQRSHLCERWASGLKEDYIAAVNYYQTRQVSCTDILHALEHWGEYGHRDDYVPTETQIELLVTSSYAKSILAIIKAKPKFEFGEAVILRTSSIGSNQYWEMYHNQGSFARDIVCPYSPESRDYLGLYVGEDPEVLHRAGEGGRAVKFICVETFFRLTVLERNLVRISESYTEEERKYLREREEYWERRLGDE